MSRQKTECKKAKITSRLAAEWLIKIKEEQWGKSVRVYKCSHCKCLHLTTNMNGRTSARKNKNSPETVRIQRKRYKNRQKLPIEIWENEGGALHSS